jgi:hypothetical protein
MKAAKSVNSTNRLLIIKRGRLSRMNKPYKLDTHTLIEIEGCSTLGYFSYGHHDNALFANAVKEDWNTKESTEEIASKTEHKWCKSVPWCGTSQCMMVYSNEHRKGYAPITVFEF